MPLNPIPKKGGPVGLLMAPWPGPLINILVLNPPSKRNQKGLRMPSRRPHTQYLTG